jgi:hypothetical protein
MGDDQGVQAIVGLTGLTQKSAMLPTTCDRSVRIELPPSFTREHVTCMENDFAVLSELAAEHPEEIVEIHNAAVRNDFAAATDRARKIGLTESGLIARGGGEVGIVLGILAILIIGAYVLSDSGSGPAPEPVGPDAPADGGISDAGADG